MICKRLIGGEMEVFPADFRMASGGSAWPTFGKVHALRCDTGRSAIKLALADWIRRSPDRWPGVWLPSYICPSVKAAVEQSDLRVMQYEDWPNHGPWLAPPAPVANDIVVIVHYFGILNNAALQWIDSVPARNWCLIEDCVQAPYTVNAGTRGEYALTSLRKWWPVPDGALLAAQAPFISPLLLPANETYISQRLTAKLLRGQRLHEPTYLDWIGASEELLENSHPRALSWISDSLLATYDIDAANCRRRANWMVLAERLIGHPHIRPWQAALAPGDVPLVFPVLLDPAQRDELRQYLRNLGIYCPIHWELSQSNGQKSLAFSMRALSLPIDQRYGEPEMAYIVARINDFFNWNLS